MTTDKTLKGFEEFSIELAKHPEIYTTFGWEDISADLKDLNEGKITSSSFTKKYVDTYYEIFSDTGEFFRHDFITYDSPVGSSGQIIVELLGFYYFWGDDQESVGPSKNFNEIITETIFGSFFIELKEHVWADELKQDGYEIEYTKHFERYFDSHIKDIIKGTCRFSKSGSIDVNGVAYREVNGEVKAFPE